MNLMNILQVEEGFKMKPYLCSAGFVTIGIGTKLHKQKGQNPDDFPITVTRRMAEEWLNTEVNIKVNRLSNGKYGHLFSKLDEGRKAIIVSMAYQMGVSGVSKFEDMWAAIANEDWYGAEAAALDSAWARKTPNRAVRHAAVLGGLTIREVYGEG